MKAAVVGCGGIAQVQGKVLFDMEEADLVACADIREDRRGAFAEKFSCKAYDTLESMLESEQIDVLHILTPHYLHVPMAVVAGGYGINVFTEKPAYILPEDYTQLLELSKKVRVGVSFQNRYNANTEYVMKLINSGEAGKVIGARAFVTWKRDKDYYMKSGWRGVLKTEGGGALINQGLHTLDLLSEFLGNASKVSARISNHHLSEFIEVEDTVEARIEFDNGANALLYISTGYSSDPPVIIELEFDKCRVRMEDPDVFLKWNTGKAENIHFESPAVLGKSYWGCGHDSCIRDFYNCIASNEPFRVDIKTVKSTMDIMFGIYSSAAKKCSIEI